MHFKTCLMQDGLKGVLNVRSKDGTFGKFSPEHTLVFCSSTQARHKGLEKDCLPEPENSTQYTVLYHLQSAFDGASIRRCRVLVFLVSGLERRSANGR